MTLKKLPAAKHKQLVASLEKAIACVEAITRLDAGRYPDDIDGRTAEDRRILTYGRMRDDLCQNLHYEQNLGPAKGKEKPPTLF